MLPTCRSTSWSRARWRRPTTCWRCSTRRARTTSCPASSTRCGPRTVWPPFRGRSTCACSGIASRMLEKAGAEVPTDWQSYIKAGEALQKAGHVGFGDVRLRLPRHRVSAAQQWRRPLQRGRRARLRHRSQHRVAGFPPRARRQADHRSLCASATTTSPTSSPDWASGHIAMGFEQVGVARQDAGRDGRRPRRRLADHQRQRQQGGGLLDQSR